MAFNYTSYDNNIYADVDEKPIIEETIEVVRTQHEKPKPLPPPPETTIKEVLPVEESPEFVEEPVPKKIPLKMPVSEVKQPVVKPTLPARPKPVIKPPVVEPEEKEEDIPEVWKVVEEMPRFGDCVTLSTRKEREACSQKQLMEFIYNHVRYPALARENGIEGTVVVSFIIDEKGNVTHPEIVRDIGGGCGKEALRIVNLMSQWHAGMQRGKKVKVMFNLPVKFRLQ